MIGIYATLPPGPHTHANPAQGGQLNPDLALSPFPKVDFGDGADGDFTCAGTIVLTRDMSFKSLTIPAGNYLYAYGFKIKVKNKLSISAGAGLCGVGSAGSAGAAGVGGAGGTINWAGSRLSYVCSPTSGGAGGNGGAAGALVTIGGVVLDPVFVNAQTLFEGRVWAGSGGGGGGAVGAGGGRTPGGVPLRILAGAKGGNGADGVYTGPGNFQFGGGGGGGGGGLVEIWCNEIDNAGVIYAGGGGGATGEEDPAAKAGGGGGGGGGAILVFYRIISGSGLGSRDVSGGAGGGTLNPGANGTAGYSYAMKIGP